MVPALCALQASTNQKQHPPPAFHVPKVTLPINPVRPTAPPVPKDITAPPQPVPPVLLVLSARTTLNSSPLLRLPVSTAPLAVQPPPRAVQRQRAPPPRRVNRALSVSSTWPVHLPLRQVPARSAQPVHLRWVELLCWPTLATVVVLDNSKPMPQYRLPVTIVPLERTSKLQILTPLQELLDVKNVLPVPLWLLEQE